MGSIGRTNTLVWLRQAHEGPDALIILGFNTETQSLKLQKPEGEWGLRLNNHDKQFGGSVKNTAPEHLSLHKTDPMKFTIPPYTAWIYLREKGFPQTQS